MNKGITAIISLLAGAAAGAAVSTNISGKTIKEKTEKVDKFKSYYNMLNQWLLLKQQGKSLTKYFEDKGYKSIAIYGMGEMGNRLYDELLGTDIVVKYAIDKNAANTYSELTVCELEDELETVDAIIVTAIFAFEEIEASVNGVVNYPVISLEDVVYGI